MRRAIGLVLLVGACGGDPGVPADAADPAVVETRSLTIGPVTVPAGEEATICVILDLGNDAPRMLRTIETELTEGTHHVIITRSDLAPAPDPTPCGAFAGGGFGPENDLVFVAQQSGASLEYPAGGGLPIAAHQSIHLEMHYFNAQPSGDLDIAGTVHLGLADADDVTLRPVELLFTGDLALLIPAGEQFTASGIFDLPDEVVLFATAAHTHQWGTLATVELLEGADDPDPVLLHSSTEWAERPLTVLDPITVDAAHKLRLTCNFDNQSDQDVTFGLGANDEMCFLWAHYVAAAP
jgi:hypothetical protein